MKGFRVAGFGWRCCLELKLKNSRPKPTTSRPQSLNAKPPQKNPKPLSSKPQNWQVGSNTTLGPEPCGAEVFAEARALIGGMSGV